MQDHLLTMRSAAHDIRGFLASATLSNEFLSNHDDQWVVMRADRIAKAIDQIVHICETELASGHTANSATLLGGEDLLLLLEEIAQIAAPARDGGTRVPRIDTCVSADAAIFCNRTHLFRVLFNLTVNAVRAIERCGGSTITLRVERAEDTIQFNVIDDGPGLPQHIIDHLYPRIDRRPAPGKRIGFGLMTAVGLTIEMGGRLHLARTSQTGTEFCLELPDTVQS